MYFHTLFIYIKTYVCIILSPKPLKMKTETKQKLFKDIYLH